MEEKRNKITEREKGRGPDMGKGDAGRRWGRDVGKEVGEGGGEGDGKGDEGGR